MKKEQVDRLEQVTQSILRFRKLATQDERTLTSLSLEGEHLEAAAKQPHPGSVPAGAPRADVEVARADLVS